MASGRAPLAGTLEAAVGRLALTGGTAQLFAERYLFGSFAASEADSDAVQGFEDADLGLDPVELAQVAVSGGSSMPVVSGLLARWEFDETAGATVVDDVGGYDFTTYGATSVNQPGLSDSENAGGYGRRFNEDVGSQIYGGYGQAAADAPFRAAMRAADLTIFLDFTTAAGGWQSNNPVLYVGSGDFNHSSDADATLLLVYTQVNSVGVSWTSTTGNVENFSVPHEFPSDEVATSERLKLHITMTDDGGGQRIVRIYLAGALLGTSDPLPPPAGGIGTTDDIWVCREEPNPVPSPAGTTTVDKDPGWGAATLWQMKIWSRALGPDEVGQDSESSGQTTTIIPATCKPHIARPVIIALVYDSEAAATSGAEPLYRWATADAEQDGTQLYGEILSVGSTRRAFSAERGITRQTVSLRLRNARGERDPWFRDASFLGYIFKLYLGYLDASARMNRLIGTFVIDRPASITANHVELELIDRLDFSCSISLPPTMAAIAQYLRDIGVIPDRFSILDAPSDRPRIPFGRAWVKAVRFTMTRGGTLPFEVQFNEANTVIALAASRRRWIDYSDQSGEFLPWILARPVEDDLLKIRPFPAAITPSSISIMPVGNLRHPDAIVAGANFPRIKYFEIQNEIGEAWWVAVLLCSSSDVENVIANPPTPVYESDGSPIIGGLEDYPTGSLNTPEVWAAVMDGPDIICRSPWGAEGSFGQSEGRDPASIIKEIFANYVIDRSQGLSVLMDNMSDIMDMQGLTEFNINDISSQSSEITNRTSRLLDQDSISTISRSLSGTVVAGALAGGEDVLSVLSSICSSFQIDAFWGPNEKIYFLTDGVNADIIRNLSSLTLVTDESDIQEGSWASRIPIGNERWGMANHFTPQGVNTSLSLASSSFKSTELFILHGRRVIRKDIDVSWRDVMVPGTMNDAISSIRNNLGVWSDIVVSDAVVSYGFDSAFFFGFGSQETIHTFTLPLRGWRYLPGDYLRIQHWAGMNESGGFTSRLGRVESAELDWSAKTVTIEVLDRGALDDVQPWIIDAASNWRRYVPEPGRYVSLTATSTTVSCGSWDAEAQEVTPGDELWIRARGSYNSGAGFVGRIASVAVGGASFELDDPAPATSASEEDFEIRRTHETPPSEADFPGQYIGLTDANDIYGSLCDLTIAAADDPAPTGTVDAAWRAGEHGAFVNLEPGYALWGP